jgi:hypothetical protein
MLKSATLSFSFDDFSQGVDWTGNVDRDDVRVLLDAKNFNLTPYKTAEKRSGCSLLYATALVIGGIARDIRAIYEHVKLDGTRLLLVQTSTVLAYYSSGWTNLKTGLTIDAKLSFARHRGYTLCVNGTDANFKIRDTTVTAVGGAVPTAPTTALGAATGLTGKYRYKTTAYRSTAPTLETNGSVSSAALVCTDDKVTVTYTAHADAQFDKLRIYRTFDETAADLNEWYLVTTVNNASSTYTDSTPDASLGDVVPTTHGQPPAAKYCVLHKNRMIYANCPALDDGESIFMFSEVGEPEYVQSALYQYFDRRDGDVITGVASLPDYLLVFKRNKIAVMEGDFSQWYTISPNIGCIAPWAIVAFVDKVMFMSEEGWKITDGRSIYDVSKKLASLIQGGSISWPYRLDYSAEYYPGRKQAMFLMSNINNVMVGHVLSSLYQDVAKEDTLDEPYIGWTYHKYENQTFTCLGKYTDSNGITKIVAGSDIGYIFLLDDGIQDNGISIKYNLETVWSTFSPVGYKVMRDFTALTKTLRMLNLTYYSSSSVTRTLEIDVDNARAVDSLSITQGSSSYIGPDAYAGILYCGGQPYFTENKGVGAACVGRKFRFRIYGDDSSAFGLAEINCRFRVSGLREGVN